MIATVLRLLPDGSRRLVTTHLVLTVISVALRAAAAVLLVPLIGALFGAKPADAWPWVGALAAVTVVGWLVDARISRIGYDLGFGLLDTAQHRVADRLTRTRLSWFTSDNTATSRQAIAATGPDLVGVIVYLLTPLLSALLLPVAIGLALLPIAWPLGVLAVLGVAVLAGAMWLGASLTRSADATAEATNAALTERLVEFARTQTALRAARRADPERSQVGEALRRQHAASLRLIARQVPGQLIFGLASQLALLVLAAAAVLLTLRQGVPAPEAIALLVVAVRYLESFTSVAELGGGLEKVTTTLRRIRDVLDAPTDPAGEREVLVERPPALSLREVTFSYEGESPVLTNLSLDLVPGSTTAIVGPSGSGKSTVLGLLAGLYHPANGSVLVDGQDLSTLTAGARRDLVSVVFQHPYLFDGTIADNISATDASAGQEDLGRAATLARVADIVERSPMGWDTRVGDGGGVLSGGERQRVSIARALLKPAPVLLLDEATSALDTENEAAIVQALAADTRERTRVIVAHRLASIRAADRVIFLEAGRIVEDGTVPDLLAAGGRFAKFWREQEASSGWRLGNG